MVKEIVVLAKSQKHGGYCVAGIEINSGEWIRPISSDSAHEGSVPEKDLVYRDGGEVQVLDRVQITFIKHSPTDAQPENYLYNSDYYWVKTGVSKIDDIVSSRGYDAVDYVFCDIQKSLSPTQLRESRSLLLLNVQNPRLFVDNYGKKKFDFQYRGNLYRFFSVCDLDYLDKVFNKVGTSISVVFSLTDRHTDNKYYKIVATIFE